MVCESNQNEKEAYAKKVLESYVKDRKIFIDTCSILHFASDKFWMHMIPFLQRYQNKVIVPLRVIEELEKHADSMKPDLAEKSKNSLKIIQQLICAGLVEVKGEKNDNFADNVFQMVFTKFRIEHKLLLITQDNNLAKDIIVLNKTQSVQGKPIYVKRINQYGFLSNFMWNSEISKNDKPTPNKEYKHEEELAEDEVFQICKAVTTLEDTRLSVSHIPTENEIVYTPRVPIRLESEVAVGAEGIIYTTNTPFVAKIYKKENMKKLN
ncbi:PIN domain-containing protein [Faecalimonas sp.]